jgi:hypothetical protein
MDSYLPPDFLDLGRFMFDAAHKGMLTDGRIRCVLIAYDAALQDPKAVIPTSLHAALEGLRRV